MAQSSNIVKRQSPVIIVSDLTRAEVGDRITYRITIKNTENNYEIALVENNSPISKTNLIFKLSFWFYWIDLRSG